MDWSLKALKWVPLIFLAVIIFIIFYFSHPFLREIHINLAGSNNKYESATIQWDSGHGFNQRESRAVTYDRAMYSVVLPHYSIKRIRIETGSGIPLLIGITACLGRYCDPLLYKTISVGPSTLEIEVSDSDRVIRSNILIIIQCIFALVLSASIIGIARYLKLFLTRQEKLPIEPSKNHSNGRRFFIISFVISLTVFGSWSIAYWPGSMTYLSFLNWAAAKSLEFNYRSPWIYQILLATFSQLFNSPGAIALLQSVLFSILATTILSFTISEGGSIIVASICLIIYLASPHITAWSTILWFDIPFSLLVVACAGFFYWLYYEKKYHAKKFCPSLGTLLTLIFLFLLVVLLRLNGVLFLFIVPSVLWLFNLMDRRRFWQFTIWSFTLFIILEYGVTKVLHVEENTAKHTQPELLTEIQWKMLPLFALFNNPGGYVSDDYDRDRRIVEKMLPLEVIKQRYSPVTVETILWDIQHRLSKEEIAEINSLYYRRIWSNFRIMFTNRLETFWYNINNFFFVNMLEHTDDNSINYFSDCWNLRFHSGWLWFHNIAGKYVNWINENPFLRMLVLTPILSMILLIVPIMFFRIVPASALYSFIILFQVPALFVVLPGVESRYFFFAYLGGFFVIPLVLLELKTKSIYEKHLKIFYSTQ